LAAAKPSSRKKFDASELIFKTLPLTEVHPRAHVIERLKNMLSGDKDMRVVSYYFFDSSKKESLSAITFLRSIMHQLIWSENLSPNIQRRLEAIFGLNGKREPDVDELETLIFELYKKLDKVFLIIDGIDEVEQDDRRIVLRFFKHTEQNQSGIKLFVAGQPEVDMTTVFGSCQAVHLRPHDLETDIRTFIDFQLEKISGILSICESDLITTIKRTLALKAQGMYVQNFTHLRQ